MRKTQLVSAAIVLLVILGGCSDGTPPVESDVVRKASVDEIAEGYVRLVLSLGEHDPGYVDAYYGDPQWREEEVERGRSIDNIRKQAKQLRLLLAAADGGKDELSALRHSYLDTQLAAVAARAAMLDGVQYSFDEETNILYGAISPVQSDEHLRGILDQIDELVPGEGPLPERVETFRQQFVIPADRLEAVFDAAIAECRERSAPHLTLPENESFTLEYVTDKPWSGYNWYQGGSYSLIQVNTDLPIHIDRAVDLGCHEGYPGHHAYNSLLEQNLVRERGWVEYSIYALYSPQSLIAEGSANYGIEMAFPGDERSRYEIEVLFPMAGLDEAQADKYYRLETLLAKLSYGSNEAARRYLDGHMTREETIQWLVDFRLRSEDSAAKDLDFIEAYRGYVINYNLGKDMVRTHVENAGDGEEERWQVFTRLLSTPRLPGDL
ncbi:MAG: hypothetical protein ACR2QU_05005 [Gammaproteobacteria bacterium]